MLEEHVDKLNLMADALIQYETLDAGQLDVIMEGRMPDGPSDWQGGADDGDADSDEGVQASADDAKDKSGESSGPIGGPAQEH
jgi:cell division protease FtsH